MPQDLGLTVLKKEINMNNIDPSSVCFVGNANQPNYISQFNQKIKQLPSDFDFDFYVCTDEPSLIKQEYRRLKVFDLKDLQKRTPETLKYEKLIPGVKLRQYPSNIRRHIISQAFEDGFDYVVWTDVDALPVASSDAFLREFTTYNLNSVHTQNAIFSTKNSTGNQQPFTNCDRVLEYLNLSEKKHLLKVHDGPTAIYYLDKEMQKDFIDSWDKITLYGYEKPFHNSNGHHSRPNCAYTFIMNDVSLNYTKSRNLFRITHDREVWY